MSQERFTRLIEGFCRESGLEGPGKLMEGNAIAVNGIPISFQYRGHAAPKHVTLYCECGKVPHDLKCAAYQAILEANMLLCHQKGPEQFFAVMPDTEQVILTNHFALEQLDPKKLQQIVAELAEQAKAWQTDYLLDAIEMPQPKQKVSSNAALSPHSRLPANQTRR